MDPDVAQIWIATLEAFVVGFLVGTFAIGKIWKSLKRNRRRRCLAMAEMCEAQCYYFNERDTHHELTEEEARRWPLFARWRIKWARLADKFKEG